MLSIVVPTLNEEKFLPCLLNSVRKQTRVKYEIIIADNDSSDNTRKIASSFGAKIIDGGLPAKARNNGAAAAAGDIILFLDADVVLPAPDFLEKTLSEFNEKKLGAAACSAYPISEKIIDKIFHQAANLYIKKITPIMPHAGGFCIFARKNVHEKINGFDETLKLAEDHDYSSRAAKISKFGILESYPVAISVRRFERDGHFNVATKYALCEAHIMLKGPIRSDIFKYRFGYPKEF